MFEPYQGAADHSAVEVQGFSPVSANDILAKVTRVKAHWRGEKDTYLTGAQR
jgi:hypothetical protein